MNTKLLTSLVAVALVLSAYNTLKPAKVEVKQPNNQYGALTGPDIPSPYLAWGGQPIFQTRKDFETATTSVCKLLSPAATTTLARTTFQVNVATNTAVTLHLATSTNGYATTSLLTNPLTLAANVQGSFSYQGTTTPDTLVGNLNDAQLDILPPNTYVTWSAAGFIGADTTKFLGTCGATFILN